MLQTPNAVKLAYYLTLNEDGATWRRARMGDAPHRKYAQTLGLGAAVAPAKWYSCGEFAAVTSCWDFVRGERYGQVWGEAGDGTPADDVCGRLRSLAVHACALSELACRQVPRVTRAQRANGPLKPVPGARVECDPGPYHDMARSCVRASGGGKASSRHELGQEWFADEDGERLRSIGPADYGVEMTAAGRKRVALGKGHYNVHEDIIGAGPGIRDVDGKRICLRNVTGAPSEVQGVAPSDAMAVALAGTASAALNRFDPLRAHDSNMDEAIDEFTRTGGLARAVGGTALICAALRDYGAHAPHVRGPELANWAGLTAVVESHAGALARGELACAATVRMNIHDVILVGCNPTSGGGVRARRSAYGGHKREAGARAYVASALWHFCELSAGCAPPRLPAAVGNRDKGTDGPARQTALLQQLQDLRCSVFGFQETRMKKLHAAYDDNFILFKSAATSTGQGGLLAGFAKHTAYGIPSPQGHNEDENFFQGQPHRNDLQRSAQSPSSG